MPRLRAAAIAAVIWRLAAGVDGQAPQRFEVASIKQAQFPNEAYFAGYFAAAGPCGMARPQIAGTRVTFRTASLCGLIRFAYELNEHQVAGRPAWMGKEGPSLFYEVELRSERELSRDEVREPLKALLAERFGLRVHREQREIPVYALVVAPRGPKLSEASIACAAVLPPEARRPGESQFQAGRGLWASCTPSTPMMDFARVLSRETDRVVVDRTGLTGRYAFRLEWTPDGAPARDDLPSLFTAIQEQLGLKLEPQRLPAQALVIDAATETPTPN